MLPEDFWDGPSLERMDRKAIRKEMKKGFEDNEVFQTTSKKNRNLLVKRSFLIKNSTRENTKVES
jgi:hypothetical protein